MVNYVHSGIPLVVICNISETFYEFLSRADSPEEQMRLIHGEQYRGDRALVWLTDPKLVFISFPVQHGQYVAEQLGYPGTEWIAPAEPTPFLCEDILREPALIERLVSYAGPERAVQIVPYATTPQLYRLVDILCQQHGLSVTLPETPRPGAMWVRDYLDTKAGFRMLASRWLPDADRLLPEGYVCPSPEMAAEVAHWFGLQGRICLIKADLGENGIGNVIYPGDDVSAEDICRSICSNPFLHGDWLTVEELISSPDQLSPSLEVFVPSPEIGPPEITYLSRQVFLDFGDFCGVLVSRDLREAPWFADLARAGQRIAERMQGLGYVGHFDLDAVVDGDQRVYLLEINTRRTGGTHTHEFAQHFFGPDYLDRVALLSHDAMDCQGIQDYDALRQALGEYLYPMGGQARGVLITGTSALEWGEFGCIVVAETAAEAMALQQAAQDQVRRLGAEG
jgi:hypothetical protein